LRTESNNAQIFVGAIDRVAGMATSSVIKNSCLRLTLENMVENSDDFELLLVENVERSIRIEGSGN
jgi:hypothetical protein